MVKFLKNVAQSFDELTASGVEEVQLIITPRIYGSALSLKYRVRTPAGWATTEHVIVREELTDPSDPTYTVRYAMAEMMEKLRAEVRKSANDEKYRLGSEHSG